MHDFADRFGAVFKRTVGFWWKDAEVKVTRVVGRWPIGKDDQISTAPSPEEGDRWAKSSFVVIEVMYPPDYTEAEKDSEGEIPRLCLAAMLALGLGPLLHNVDVYDNRFVVFAQELPCIYLRLPPVDHFVYPREP